MASAAKVTRTVASYLLLFVLIFGLAGTVDHAEFRKQFREKRAISIGFFGQFVLLPFFGFCAVKAFNLTALGKPTAEEMAALASGREDPANATATPPITYADFNVGIEAVILLLTTSSPGGSYSNWWCFIFNADLALSVAMTTVSSIASVFMLPINLAIYLNATNSDSIDIEYGPLSIAVTIVVFGIGFGLLASAHFPHKRHVFHTSANVAGLSLIALGLVSTSGSRDGLFGQPWNFFAGVAAPCVVGVVGSFAMSTAAGLTKPQVLSVGIETVYQNTALALSVALASPAPARAAAVPVFYQAVQVVTLFVYSVVGWKMGWTFAPADVSLWRMIVTNYQPVFQKESALVKEELERTRRTLREAEAEAEALGLKSRGLLSAATVRSSLRLLSPSPTPGHSFKAGKSASALLGLGGAAVAPQPRDGEKEGFETPPAPGRSMETPGRLGGVATPLGDGAPAKHRRTMSMPVGADFDAGAGLGLGLGEIEQEAVAAVGVRDGPSRDKRGFSTGDVDDFVTPLKTRVKALEELNIRLARRSTRRITYGDFVGVLQGTASAFASGARDAAAAVASIPTRMSQTFSTGRESSSNSRMSTPAGHEGAGKGNRIAPAPP